MSHLQGDNFAPKKDIHIEFHFNCYFDVLMITTLR